MDADQLMSISDIVDREAKKVGFETLGCERDHGASIAYANQSWGIKSGSKVEWGSSFQNAVVDTISDQLRKLECADGAFFANGNRR